MPSPIRIEHMEADLAVLTWLGMYVAATPGVRGGGDGSVRLDADNEVQPDALLRIEEACGGQSRVGADGFVEGAPELVVEISGSSVSYDLHAKLNVYRRAGVQEYVVWRVYDGAINWFMLDEGRYVAQAPDEQGIYSSRLFPACVCLCRPCWMASWPTCWLPSSRACRRQNMRRSWHNCRHALERCCRLREQPPAPSFSATPQFASRKIGKVIGIEGDESGSIASSCTSVVCRKAVYASQKLVKPDCMR